MITLNLPPEWTPRLATAVERYCKLLGAYINKSPEDIREIEIYQLILEAVRDSMLEQ